VDLPLYHYHLLSFGYRQAGFIIKRRIKRNDFLTSGRNIPLWITSLAFYLRKPREHRKYWKELHRERSAWNNDRSFYWVGAIRHGISGRVYDPLSLSSRVPGSVPEFLKLRFDEKNKRAKRNFFAVMTIFSSGISLRAKQNSFECHFALGL